MANLHKTIFIIANKNYVENLFILFPIAMAAALVFTHQFSKFSSTLTIEI